MSKSLAARGKSGFRLLKFFREVRAELTQVTFPSRAEGIRLTTVVMIVTLVAAGVLYVLDLIFSYAITWLITL